LLQTEVEKYRAENEEFKTIINSLKAQNDELLILVDSLRLQINTSLKSNKKTTFTQQGLFENQGLVVLECKLTPDYVIGKLKNTTDKEFSLVIIKFNLYDDEDTQVGTANDIISHFEANGLWKFNAVVADKNATSVRVKEIFAR
jgi:hypothetical protein